MAGFAKVLFETYNKKVFPFHFRMKRHRNEKEKPNKSSLNNYFPKRA